MWVKGLIFGLIRRNEQGEFCYKDETNDAEALFGYWTSLGTSYRDQAFQKFKLLCPRLQAQFEQHMTDRLKAEGQGAIDAIIADARINYLDKYSLNDVPADMLRNDLYKGITRQLTEEVNYVNRNL